MIVRRAGTPHGSEGHVEDAPQGGPLTEPGTILDVSDHDIFLRPRRIVHVARRFTPMVGGIERYVLDVAVAQARHGVDIRVVTLRRDVLRIEEGPLASEETLDGMRVIRLPGVGNQRFGLCLRPDRIAREVHRADAVHLHDLRFMVGFVCVAARLMRRPLIFHTHGLLLHTTFAKGLKRLLMRSYYGPMLRIGRATIVASSDHDKDMLLAEVPGLAGQTVTLLNAVDLTPYRATGRRPVPGRLLVIGRVAGRKGIDRLLAGLAVVHGRANAPTWSLEIAGTEDDGERQRLTEIVAAGSLEGVVTFHGGYSEREHRILLEEAAAAIFPSRAEGFGLALLEAMAAGVPLLASDIPSHRALLGPDLVRLLVDFDDPRAVADAIESMIRQPEAELTDLSTALRAAAEPFDIERLRSEIDVLYRRLGVPPEDDPAVS
jgi:alpha-1,3-mannosyltransferase